MRFDALAHPELVHKHPANLVSPVKMRIEKVRLGLGLGLVLMKWFEKVRRGSMILNHPELVH